GHQRVLRRIALAGVSDDNEAKIAGAVYAVRPDTKEFVAASVDPHNCVDHAGAPGIYTYFRQLLINAAGPTFPLQVPPESPHRIKCYKERSQRKSKLQNQNECGDQ